MASDYVQVVCGMYQSRSPHDEQPFLRSLRHPPCVVGEAQVEFRLPAVNHGGLANVEHVRRILLDNTIPNEMAAMPETTLWYGADCVAFIYGTLSAAALLQKCPECQNLGMQTRAVTVSDVSTYTSIHCSASSCSHFSSTEEKRRKR